MISYSELIGWRNLCEYLDGCWYKFQTCWTISKKCRHVLPNLYDPGIRTHREFLYNHYLIQFITYQEHPILSFASSRVNRRKYKDVKGWRLTKDWEYKIDYLEKIVLFGFEPEIKPWEADLKKRISERERRRKALELEVELSRMKAKERKLELQRLGLCWRCRQPLITLMIDCVVCGARQEDDATPND